MVYGYGRRPNMTLSPLARPGKAIDLEAQIELWSAIQAAVPLFSFSTSLRVGMTDRIFDRSRIQDAARVSRGWLPRQGFFVRVARRRGGIFLDSPFHRTTPAAPF